MMLQVQHFRGLIVDFYGVLTDGIDTAMRAWSEQDGVDYEQFSDAMAEWFGGLGEFEARFNPVHALERGELEVPQFERKLAARLVQRDGSPVGADGLVRRMFSRFLHSQDMASLVRRIRMTGVRTALLSNSWGDHYLRTGWHDMFDAVVISGEVGMRKPEQRIFELTLQRLSLTPGECVFVDDHDRNISAAQQLGITGVLHRQYESTLNELEALFDRSFNHDALGSS
jgi:epoxide hydrolase-like predicted phosphatase